MMLINNKLRKASSYNQYLHIKGFVFPINHGCQTRSSHLTVEKKRLLGCFEFTTELAVHSFTDTGII